MEYDKLNKALRKDSEELDDLDFALSYITKQGNKKNAFPINNEVNTRMSSIFFEKEAQKYEVDATNIAALHISKACEVFDVDISELIKTAAEKCPKYIITNIYLETNGKDMNQRTKTASPTQSKNYYALVKEAGDETSHQYAMPNAEYVKTASDYFDKHCKSFTVGDRHKYASTVLKRSAELGVDVTSETILKYAGVAYNSNIADAILLRQTLLEVGSDMSGAFNKLASYQGSTSPETFANVLFELDKKAGLDKYYGRYLPDPYLSTFSTGISKTASSLYSHSKGGNLSDDGFKKMASEKYTLLKQYFGHTLADGLKKEGSIAFEALPDDAKKIISGIANGDIR